jgi:hypothetical protein
MGPNIFGRTDKERIQITEKTLANEGLYGLGGLTIFCKIYLKLNHKNVKMPKGMRLTKNPNKIDSKRKYRIEKLFEWEK